MIIYHYANYFRNLTLSCAFLAQNEMCSLARTVAPSSIVKHDKMQDGGGRETGSALIPMGREIWFQNRVVREGRGRGGLFQNGVETGE